LLNLQHHGRCRSGNGRGGVDQKPAKSGAITSSVSQYYAYRVDAVGKVVREHCGGDDGADGRGDFKGKTDCDSIEEAVRRQASRADRAASPLFLGPWAFVAMWRDGPVQEHVGDKTDRNRGGDELRAQYRTPQLEGLRDQIEESRADQGACAEAQYQVKSILLIQPEQAAQQRRMKVPMLTAIATGFVSAIGLAVLSSASGKIGDRRRRCRRHRESVHRQTPFPALSASPAGHPHARLILDLSSRGRWVHTSHGLSDAGARHSVPRRRSRPPGAGLPNGRRL
jgi:hypothetical protein